jgi:hypothetical protein
MTKEEFKKGDKVRLSKDNTDWPIFTITEVEKEVVNVKDENNKKYRFLKRALYHV